MKRESVIDPVLEKPLLELHRAMSVDSFWKAVQQVLSAAIPNRLIGLTLQHHQVLPMIVRWTLPMPDGFFAAEPLQSYMAGRPRKKFVRVTDVFSNRSSLMKSAFYRRYFAPQNCRHGVVLFFWKGRRLICAITIMRTAKQGDLSPTEMKLLQRLYPQFLATLYRLSTLEREQSARMAFEEFLRQLPLPAILLRWNLRPIYQNRAARDFCAVWEKGPEQARLIKASSPIPPEISDRCGLLKEQWAYAKRPTRSEQAASEEHVRHPRSPHLRATIRMKQLNAAGVARPHFIIKCEDLRRHAAPRDGVESSRLPYFVRLTERQREVVRLVCDGRSNQEIADETGLSLPTVKKHLHAIFRKLGVTSRSRLMALIR